jgi:TM2 domain-containing membrane protein YozV
MFIIKIFKNIIVYLLLTCAVILFTIPITLWILAMLIEQPKLVRGVYNQILLQLNQNK